MGYFSQGTLFELETTTATSGGTTSLVNTSTAFQIFTGTLDHTVKLPNATTVAVGMHYRIVNSGTGTISVQANSGTAITTVAAGKSKTFVVIGTGSVDGQFEEQSPGGGGVSAADIQFVDRTTANSYSSVSRNIAFNPEEIAGDFWKSQTGLPSARIATQNFTLNGFGYATGGSDGSTIQTSNYRYTSDNDYWLTRAVTTVAKWLGAGFQVASNGYIAGGNNTSSAVATTYSYNDISDAWTTKTSLLSNRSNLESETIVLSYPLVSAGYDGVSIIGTSEVYDSTANAWYSRTTMPANREDPGSFALNGYGYVAGGDNAGVQTTSFKFDEYLNQWKTLLSVLSSGRSGCSGGHSNGFGYILSDTSSNVVDRYSDLSSLFASKAHFATALIHSATFNVNGIMYAVGGSSGVAVTTVQSYSDATYLAISATPATTAIPSAISLTSKIARLAHALPIRLRTDGNTWKNLVGNSASTTALNETITTKFTEYTLGYAVGGDNAAGSAFATNEFFNYDANAWTARQSMGSNRTITQTFNAEGYGFAASGDTAAYGSLTNTTERYDSIANVWASRANITTTRGFGMAATITQTGYVHGGSLDSGASSLNTNESYSNTSNAWSTKTNLTTARSVSAGDNLLDRSYLVAGANSVAISSVEYYDPILNAWATAATYPAAETNMSVFVIEGYLYSAGGSSNTATRKYNPQTNSWSSGGTIPNATYAAPGFRFAGFGYVAGGFPSGITAVTSRYNPSADSWVTSASLNTARRSARSTGAGPHRKYEIQVGVPAYYAGLGAATWAARAAVPVAGRHWDGSFVDGKGIIRGYQQSSSLFATSYSYKPVTNSWAQIVDLSTVRTYVNDFVLYGDTYSCGGYIAGAQSTVDRMNSTLNANIAAAALNSGVYFGAGATLSGYGYVCAGNTTVPSNNHQQYNVSTNSWANKGATTTNRAETRGTALNGFIYIIANSTATTSTERYNDASNSWAASASLQASKSNRPACMLLNDKITDFGGYDVGATTTAECEVYSSVMNAWVVSTTKTTVNASGGKFSSGDTIYMAGGVTTIVDDSVHEAYVPALKSILLSIGLNVT